MLRFDEDDQENLLKLIQPWPAENQFHFRRCDSSETHMLFVHQTAQQSTCILLARYGCELTCLDATYKTMQYALPLFFLVVKTNVDYQVGTQTIYVFLLSLL